MRPGCREHNDANIIGTGAHNHPEAEADALGFVEAFLATPFSQRERHLPRIEMLTVYEMTSAIAGDGTA